MRYRRKRYYKKSTNVIRMKFQSFMDISTQEGQMQIISVSAGGKNLLERLPAQFAAYKYYKIGNIAVKLVPASSLPVDPSGLSYEPGENQVDPRDQLTPGMMRITNGEDVFEDISGLSAEVQHQIYNTMLLDPRWFKWMLQSGVKRHATPRYWQIGQLHQDKWPGATVNIPTLLPANDDPTVNQGFKDTASVMFREPIAGSGSGASGTPGIQYIRQHSDPLGLFQVGHRGVLGWLPTDGMQYSLLGDQSKAYITSPPEIEVMKILLPPAYDTRFYYRMFVTETVYFREPVVMAADAYRPLDVFHYTRAAAMLREASPNLGVSAELDDKVTGGNYGDD